MTQEERDYEAYRLRIEAQNLAKRAAADESGNAARFDRRAEQCRREARRIEDGDDD